MGHGKAGILLLGKIWVIGLLKFRTQYLWVPEKQHIA